MPHRPFKSSPHTTQGKPDPSARPFPGVLTGTCTATDNTVSVELERTGCSLSGLPVVVALYSDGETPQDAACTAATLNGTTLTLTFNAAVGDDFGGVMFADRDPALRGRQGEYADSNPIPVGEPPTATLGSAQFDEGGPELHLYFTAPVDWAGSSDAITVTFADGVIVRQNSDPPDSGDGTAHVTFQGWEASGTPGGAQTLTFAAGVFKDAATGADVPGVFEFTWEPL